MESQKIKSILDDMFQFVESAFINRFDILHIKNVLKDYREKLEKAIEEEKNNETHRTNIE